MLFFLVFREVLLEIVNFGDTSTSSRVILVHALLLTYFLNDSLCLTNIEMVKIDIFRIFSFTSLWVSTKCCVERKFSIELFSVWHDSFNDSLASGLTPSDFYVV